MKNVRINTDQRFNLSLKAGGALIDMTSIDVLSLYMYCNPQKARDGAIKHSVSTSDTKVLEMIWPADVQRYLGSHSVHGTIRFAGAVASFDVPAVNVVSLTSEADISTDTIVLEAPVGTEDLTATITIQGMGPQGPQGDKMTYADLTQEDKEDLYEGVSEVMKPLLASKQNALTDTDGSYGQRVAELEKEGIASQEKLSELEKAINGGSVEQEIDVTINAVDGYLTETGIVSSQNWKTSQFVNVKGYSKIKFLGATVASSTTTDIGYGFYGSTQGLLEFNIYEKVGDARADKKITIDIPDNVTYIRFSYLTTSEEKAYCKLIKENLIGGLKETKIDDAPRDGQKYGRQNGGWVALAMDERVAQKTLADYVKREKGVFVSYENGAYSVNANSSSWESWVVPNEGVTKIDAVLGKSTSLQCNIIFFKSDDLSVSNIISHITPPSINASGAVEYSTTSIPSDCKVIVISNRLASYDTPTAVIHVEEGVWDAIDANRKKIGTKAESAELDDIKGKVDAMQYIIPNVYITRQQRRKFATYNDLIAAYDALMAAHPAFITKNALGEASDGQILYEYVLSCGAYNKEGLRGVDAAIDKPVILLEAGIHGYEPESNTSLYIFVADLVNGELSLSKIRDNFDFKVIPCLNPYGYDNNRRGNYNNVDINRNFEIGWTLQGDASADPSYYGGASPASEPETQIMQKWMRDNASACLFIDFHNSSFFNEISCIGGSSELDGMDEFKKKYLVGVRGLSSYLITQLGLPDTSIWGYTFTRNLGGSSGMFRNSIGLVGGTLETSQNINGAGENSPTTIAVGADVLGTILLSVFDLYKIA